MNRNKGVMNELLTGKIKSLGEKDLMRLHFQKPKIMY
jgi:hypothetical protein